MAPQKSMVISQQQQQQPAGAHRDLADHSQAAKPRKRKGKQQATGANLAPQLQVSGADRQQQVSNGKPVGTSNSQDSLAPKSTANKGSQPVTQQQQQQQQAPSTVPSEQTNTIKSQQQSPASSPAKEQAVVEIKKRAEQIVANTVIAKQLSAEEADDIDAGIELDGSSNSGSSIKDINEDQSKSTSVSPIMAQSNLVNENRNSTKHAVEVAPIEQLTGALCTDVTPPSKKIGTTKQQLAANQQVIDADEQQLQQKLQNKQRKSSLQQDTNNNSNNNTSQSIIAPQSPALCKVCEQHVYQMERMLAEKAVYHKRCFRCHQCKIQLRVDNYSSHEGQVYCKAHHRQIFQPQVRLDSEDDVDIVAKSTSKTANDYLNHRGRLSELSFSFLHQTPEEIRKRQMIICENEPAELPKDVVRCGTKVDDGIDQINLNLNNILEKFERGTTSNGEESQPSSAGVVIDKPSFNIKKTLMAFETKSLNQNTDEGEGAPSRSERPVVKKLTNLNNFLNCQSSTESEPPAPGATVKPLAVRRSESLMIRLKKYESRIAGEQVADDEDSDEGANNNNNNNNNNDKAGQVRANHGKCSQVPKKLTSINLSSLKNQWENGDINKKRFDDDDNNEANGGDTATSDSNCNGGSLSAEKNEELYNIRQQLARKKVGESGSTSIKNIYENAIREAQLQQIQQASRRNSSDLLALNGFSTTEIQQQLLQNGSSQSVKTPTTPNKDHFQLNLSNKANKLKEKFEQGLITNSSQDDSDQDGDEDAPAMTKLEQIRQEKLEDLSVFTEGEIKAREARSLFQQIDRRLSAANGQRQPPPNSRSLATISASMQTKLMNQMNSNGAATMGTTNNYNNGNSQRGRHQQEPSSEKQQPIRLTNNVRT